jgi:hypothetical protein
MDPMVLAALNASFNMAPPPIPKTHPVTPLPQTQRPVALPSFSLCCPADPIALQPSCLASRDAVDAIRHLTESPHSSMLHVSGCTRGDMPLAGQGGRDNRVPNRIRGCRGWGVGGAFAMRALVW